MHSPATIANLAFLAGKDNITAKRQYAITATYIRWTALLDAYRIIVAELDGTETADRAVELQIARINKWATDNGHARRM